MTNSQRHLLRGARTFAAILAGTLFTIGCSLFDPPTASTPSDEQATQLWSPKPGDEIQPGVQVPIILDENYWNTGSLDGGSGGGGGRRFLVPVPVFEEMDEEGGTIYAGRHNFVVPAGAVDESTNFSLALASAVGIAVDCGPSPFYFNDGHAVRLNLSYEGTQYDNDYAERNGFEALDPEDLNIWWDPLDGSPLQMIEAGRFVNTELKTISVEVDHFSRYILG
ncbi:hypothetical protein IT157_08380 [bacterium]|nr:hypothetical protein [bacterium]